MNFQFQPFRQAITVFSLVVMLALPATIRSAHAQNDDNELFLVSQKAFEDGFYDVAIRYITQLLDQFPQSKRLIEAKLLLGQCYFFKNQYLKAYEIFQGLLQFNDYKDATLYWLGETYLKGSDYKQAEDHYLQLIKLYPQSIYVPQAYYSLGWGSFEQGNYDKATQYLEKVIREYPDHSLAEDAMFKRCEAEYNQRHLDETINLFKKFVLLYPKSNRHAEAYFYIAEAYYYQEDYLTAVTYYAKTSEISYDNKLVLMAKVSMGWSYLRLQKHKLAQDYFDKAEQFAAEKHIISQDVYLGKATLFSEMHESLKAIEAYTRIINDFPQSERAAEAYLGIANNQYLLNQFPQAISTYQTIIEKYAKDPAKTDICEKATFGIAWSYLKSGDIDASVKNFELVKNNTESQIVKISALTQIGDAYQDVERYNKAIEIYDQILTEYPDSPYTDYVQYRQGIALLKLNKIDAATLSFQTLQANFPQSKYINDTHYYLAVAYYTSGVWAVAREHIEEFLASQSQPSRLVAEGLHLLGVANYKLRDYVNALQTFQKIIKNHPQEADLIESAELYIAKCYYAMGEVNEALKRFRTISLKTGDAEPTQEAIIWLGDHYIGQSDFDSAIGFYQQFVQQFPNSNKLELVYYDLGQAFEAKKEYDKAINAFKMITDQNDKKLYANAKLAIAGIFSRELDPSSAIQTYENIVQSSPEFKRDAYVKIAEIQKNNQQYTEAIASLKNALSSKKDISTFVNAEIQFAIADNYELAIDPEQAIEEYLKIPYLYKTDVTWNIKAYLRIARLFEDKEKWGEAAITYRKIIEYNTSEKVFAQEKLDWMINNSLIKENP